ncbi:hypothetical protein [Azospirillum sp. sgz301742]
MTDDVVPSLSQSRGPASLGGARAAWLGTGALGTLLLLLPALYNGYPLVYFDTGGYLERGFELTLFPGRSLVYGLFMRATLALGGGLWPLVAVQSALVVWLALRTARLVEPALRPADALALAGLTALVTGLPWYAAQAAPDFLSASLVLALYLVAYHWTHLSVAERCAAGGAVVLAVASHLSHMPLAIGLIVITAAVSADWRHCWIRVRRTVALVMAGVAAVPLAAGVFTGEFRLTPGGAGFVFGRLVQDGIVARFLDDHCPSPAYRLCAYRAELPRTADDWLWMESSPLAKLGGWEAATPEMQRIAWESLLAYPGQHLLSAARATWDQLRLVRTGEGLDEVQHHTVYTIGRYLPQEVPAFAAARQQAFALPLGDLNAVHVPVAQGALVLLLPAAALAYRRRWGGLAHLGLFTIVALLSNAFVCGALSNPHDRYQSRLVWLAVFTVALTACRLLRESAVRQPCADTATD